MKLSVCLSIKISCRIFWDICKLLMLINYLLARCWNIFFLNYQMISFSQSSNLYAYNLNFILVRLLIFNITLSIQRDALVSCIEIYTMDALKAKWCQGRRTNLSVDEYHDASPCRRYCAPTRPRRDRSHYTINTTRHIQRTFYRLLWFIFLCFRGESEGGLWL